MDKADGQYQGFQISMGAIEEGKDPRIDIGTDLSFHSRFSNERLTAPQRGDVILAKVFLKNLGLYGEHIGGFATEQLMLHYGSFDALMASLSEVKRIHIDFSGKTSRSSSELEVPVRITYPFCGENNLARVSEEQFSSLVRYAAIVQADPQQFHEDSCRMVNEQFWRNRSADMATSECLSTPDTHLNHLENRVLRNRLPSREGMIILDLGCSNGMSAKEICREGDYLVGLDLDEQSIRAAVESTQDSPEYGFVRGGMTTLPFPDGIFDAVYAKRSVSNLPSNASKQKAVVEVGRILKPGGLFFYSDLLPEGYDRINEFRKRFGLDEIPLPYHANLATENEVLGFSQKAGLDLVGIEDFSSSYYFLSRVLHPAVLRLWGGHPRSDSLANSIYAKIPSLGKMGVNKLFTFTKNGK